MRIVLNDGEEYEGSPVEILEAMKSKTMFTDFKSLDDYIAFLVENARKFQGRKLSVTGATIEERAASLLTSFQDAGLAREVK